MRTTGQSKRNETGQISLFALDYSTKQGPYLVPTVHSYSPVKEAERLAGNLLEYRSLTRSTDPITSKVAAEKTKEFRARHIAKIWNCLKENGSKNFKEIALLTGLEPVQVARRRKEMEEDKLIEVLNETKDGCALWKAK